MILLKRKVEETLREKYRDAIESLQQEVMELQAEGPAFIFNNRII